MSPSDTERLIGLFHDVIGINQVAGNTYDPCPRTAHHQVGKIIQPEAAELRAGLEASDRHEIRDGIADVLFTLAGLYGRMGLSLEDLETSIPAGTEEGYTEAMDSYGYLERLDSCLKALLVVVDTNADINNIVFTGIADAAVIWTLQLAELQGVDVLADLAAVVDSNWTKFDDTEEQAALTYGKYRAIGVQTHFRETMLHQADGSLRKLYVTFSSVDQTGTDNKSYPKDKWLKSVNFKDTNFNEDFVEAVTATTE